LSCRDSELIRTTALCHERFAPRRLRVGKDIRPSDGLAQVGGFRFLPYASFEQDRVGKFAGEVLSFGVHGSVQGAGCDIESAG
ncbi:MAG: hypothetical protein L0G36_09235, partial [Brevibacterium sp.]|nr:hypothetical protein [Brevibacterium sp.]